MIESVSFWTMVKIGAGFSVGAVLMTLTAYVVIVIGILLAHVARAGTGS